LKLFQKLFNFLIIVIRWLISISFIIIFFLSIKVSINFSILIGIAGLGLNPIVFNLIQRTFTFDRLFIFSKKFIIYLFFYIVFFIGAFNLSSIEKKNELDNLEVVTEKNNYLEVEDPEFEKISIREKIIIDKWNSMDNGELSFYKNSHPDNNINLDQYRFLCENSNYVNNHAFRTGLVTEPSLYIKIVNNGGKLFKTDIYWSNSLNICIVEFKVQGLIDGTYYDKLFEKIVTSFVKDESSSYISHLTSY
jgi:hypothetical protein